MTNQSQFGIVRENSQSPSENIYLSRDKLSMASGMKGISCIKFDFFKVKNTDLWATMFEHVMLTSRKGREELLSSSCVNFMLGCLEWSRD